jgi:Glutathione S-transferase, N-terminal domain
MWFKGPHPCWQVQKALDEAGMQYEVVKHPAFPRSKRTEYIALSGQDRLPAIQLEDGTVIRRESKELIQMVRSGQLPADAGSAAGAEPDAGAAPEAGAHVDTDAGTS